MNILPELYDKANQLQVKDGLSLLEQVKNYLNENKKNRISKVLDVGCGTGNITQLIPDYISCDSIIGMDLSDSMIDFAKQHHPKEQINYVIADISSDLDSLIKNLQVSPGSIDLLLSIHCLHWIPEPLHIQTLNNIRTLMSPGSTCFLLFFSWSDWLPIQEQIILHPRWRKYFKDVLESESRSDSNSNNLTPDVNENATDRIRRKSSAPFMTMETISYAERVNLWRKRLIELDFEPVTVKVERVSFKFKDLAAFAAEAKAICHYMKYIPEDEREMFFDSYYDLIVARSNMKDQSMTLEYENIFIVANKPNK